MTFWIGGVAEYHDGIDRLILTLVSINVRTYIWYEHNNNRNEERLAKNISNAAKSPPPAW